MIWLALIEIIDRYILIFRDIIEEIKLVKVALGYQVTKIFFNII